MSEQPDFRRLVAEYVAGQHRPTRHADICLDPQLADRIDTHIEVIAKSETLSEVKVCQQNLRNGK